MSNIDSGPRPERRPFSLAPRTVAGKIRMVVLILVGVTAVNLGYSRWTTDTLEGHLRELDHALGQQDVLWESFGRLSHARQEVRYALEIQGAPVDSTLSGLEVAATAIHDRLGRGFSRAGAESRPFYRTLRTDADSAFQAWRAALTAATPQARDSVAAHGNRLAGSVFRNLIEVSLPHEDRRVKAAHAAFDELGDRAEVIGWVLFGTSVLVSGLALLALIRGLTGRFRRLETAATRMGGGDLSQRVPEDAVDELGDVGRAFNQMAVRLTGALSQIERRNEDLSDALTLLVSLIENMPAGVLVEDNDRRILRTNPQFRSIVGEEAARDARTIPDLMTAVDRSAGGEGTDRLTRAFANPGRAGAETLEMEDGRHVSVEAVPVLDSGGEVRGRMWLFRDVTDRDRAEAALRRSESRFRQFFEEASDAHFLLDGEGWFLDVNRKACDTLGYSRNELLSMRLSDVEVVDDPRGLRELWERMERGDDPQVECTFRSKDGTEVPLDVRLRLFEFEDRRVALADARDLSDRKMLERKLAHAMKMEAVGRLAGGIAHDFNNILTSIRGHAALVREEPAGSDELLEGLSEIDRDAGRAAELVRQLLAFSRQQVLSPELVSPAEVIGGMQLMLDRLITEDIVLRLVAPDDGARIRVDRGQLEQVILNLAINARDAMVQGGEIEVRLRSERVGPGEGSGPASLSPGSYVRLTFRDTGSGIEPDVLPRVFDPFFSTKPVGRGTGLGLATVYGVVRQSGGEISVRSQPGVGTRFDLWFPRVEEASPPAESPAIEDGAPEREHVSLEGRTVMVVEDEASVRNVLVRVLERAGCRVVSAEDGAAALRLLDEVGQSVELLITDVVMPEMSGAELAEHVADLNRDLPVLFVSGYTADELRERGGEGILLEKPFTPNDLLAKVSELLPPPLVQAGV